MAEPEPEEGEPPPLAVQHAFLDFAKKYDWVAVEEILRQAPHPKGLANAQPSGRWPALHQAAQCGNPDAVDMLLRFSANPLLRNRDGQTARELAQQPAAAERLKIAESAAAAGVHEEGESPAEPEARAFDVSVAEKPRTFSQNFAKSVEYSPMVGSRSAAYDRGSDVAEVLAGLREAASDPKAVAKYGQAGTAKHYADLEKVLTRGLSDIDHTTTGRAPLQLMKNVISAYTLETYFGGTGYSVLNTNLRDQKEYPAMAPVAQLFHHAVSELAASDEYGHGPTQSLRVDGATVEFTLCGNPIGVGDFEYSGHIIATEPRQAETGLTNAAALSGAVALTFSGAGTFVKKAERAAAAGAMALIVISSHDHLDPSGAQRVEVCAIPVLRVRQSDSVLLQAATEVKMQLYPCVAFRAMDLPPAVISQ